MALIGFLAFFRVAPWGMTLIEVHGTFGSSVGNEADRSAWHLWCRSLRRLLARRLLPEEVKLSKSLTGQFVFTGFRLPGFAISMHMEPILIPPKTSLLRASRSRHGNSEEVEQPAQKNRHRKS